MRRTQRGRAGPGRRPGRAAQRAARRAPPAGPRCRLHACLAARTHCSPRPCQHASSVAHSRCSSERTPVSQLGHGCSLGCLAACPPRIHAAACMRPWWPVSDPPLSACLCRGLDMLALWVAWPRVQSPAAACARLPRAGATAERMARFSAEGSPGLAGARRRLPALVGCGPCCKRAPAGPRMRTPRADAPGRHA